MRTVRRSVIASLVVTSAVMAGCGGGEPQAEPEEAAEGTQPAMAVEITEPADGSSLVGPVRVVFGVTGLDIVPAGTDQPRSGHHHLLIDADLPAAGQPVPSTEGYMHFGQAQTEIVLEDLSPGPHRLIAVVGDFAHVPLQPLVVDTVHITVR